MTSKVTAEQIDAILPQTQCGLCTYNGCMPYASAIATQNAAINLCPPGGVKGLFALAELVNQDPIPFIEDMQQKAKPKARAVIRESECIGCTKCIQACPVDAILGSSQSMHTVIANECTGCELCIAPCPVDCIDMEILADQSENKEAANIARKRYQARQKRLSVIEKTESRSPADKKAYIAAALERRKSNSKF